MTENTNAPTTLTDEEQDLVRRSAFSAIALVSKADPGFFSMFKESMAGSRAFAEAPAGVQQLLREGGFPTPPTGSPEQVESTTLSELGQAVQILEAKAPQQAQGFKDVILAASDRVANASDGVAPEEQAIIEKIRAALSGAGGAVMGDGGFDPEQQRTTDPSDLPPPTGEPVLPHTPAADPSAGPTPERPGPLG